MEYVNARWMYSLHGFLHGIKWIIFLNHLEYFQNQLLEVGLTQNRETVALQTLTIVDSILSCVRTCINRNSLK
jgi:hypothetical protein